MRVELVATFRESFGLSVYDAGDKYSWREFVELVTASLGDGTTRLGAKAAGWAYRASVADVAAVAQAFAKNADRYTPWGMQALLDRRRERHVSARERHEATQQLAEVSIFRNMPGFEESIQ